MAMSAEPHILVVDDNLLFSSRLLSGLRQLGAAATLVDVAGEVVSRARAVKPDAILIDLASRSLSSAQRVRELKADADLASIPIVGYCGHLETQLIDDGRAAGCDVVVANSALVSGLPDVIRRAGVELPRPSP
jgi:CheY-like chemotaxis protein